MELGMSGVIDSTTYRSPKSNYHDGRSKAIAMIVVHATASETLESAAGWLCNPASEVSTHYIISQLGRIYQLVDDNDTAYHAGKSVWHGLETTFKDGTKSVNDCSLGIELENRNDGKDPYPAVQIAALTYLVKWKMSQYKIKFENVVRHLDVATPKGRKTDPMGFDWISWQKSLIGNIDASRDVWDQWGTQFPLYHDEKVFGIPQFWMKRADMFGQARSHEIWVDGIWCFRAFEFGIVFYVKKNGRVAGVLNSGLAVDQ
jgi:hypothetical protein